MIKIPNDFKPFAYQKLIPKRDIRMMWVGHRKAGKSMLLEFDKYINSKDRIREIKAMKTTQYYMVDAIRDVWNRMKKGEY